MANEPSTASTVSGTRFVFLDVLRAVAVSLVMYCHVVGVWLHQHGVHSILDGAADPLAFALNVGNFGVVLFFLVSGFIVTHTGFSERPRQYAAKRLLRIYPMLAVAVLLSAGLFTIGLHPLTTGDGTEITPGSLVANISLANYLMAPRVVLVDVGWTLIIEVLFYALLLAALPLLRRAVWPVIAGELTVVAAILATSHLGGPTYALFAVNVGYLPALLLGQAIWASWSRRIPLWTGAALAVAAAAEYVWAGIPGMGRQPTVYHYNLTLALGVVVFLSGLLAERKLRRIKVIGYLADRSYSLYLLHALLAISLMNVLYPRIGYPAALAAGVAVTLLGAEAGYRWVERPSMRLARRWSTRYAAPGPPGKHPPAHPEPCPATAANPPRPAGPPSAR
ncbi:MAG TPA: acyltransferase [Amycolatopsis sp.]|nr:acyltransferase [Amycolatopsis sp.]